MKLPQFFFEADGAGGGGGGAAGAGAAGNGGAGGGTATLLSGAGAGAGAGDGQPGAGAGTGAAESWVDSSGKFTEKWLNVLPEDIRGHPALKSMGTMQDLAKSYIHTKGLVGSKLDYPGEGASPEAIASWRRTVGAPESPEGYLGKEGTLRPESIPEDFWNKDAEKGFLAVAHKHHLPPGAVKDILGFQASLIEAELGKSEEVKAQTLANEKTTLQKEWGSDFEARLNIVARMAATVGLKTDDPIFTNSRVCKAFHAMATLVSEDRLVQGDEKTALGGSVAERIRDIQDPTSTSQLAKQYQGLLGDALQKEAQALLHQLMASQQTKK